MASRLTATTSLLRVFSQLLQYVRQRSSFSAHRAALMIKIDLAFPAFSFKFLDFGAQFCFRCKFSSHEKRRTSCSSQVLTVAWFSLNNHNSLLRIETNEITSFCIDDRLHQMAFFRVRQSGQRRGKGHLLRMLKHFEIKKLFIIIKTNRLHVAVCLFSSRWQRTSKCGKNVSDTLGCASCATFLFLPHFDVICDLLETFATTTTTKLGRGRLALDYSL